jgi:hypothetical protein
MALPLTQLVLKQLGYSFTQINSNVVVFPSGLTNDQLESIKALSDQLVALDLEIATNIRDSMAIKVQDLTLNYSQYIRETRGLASQTLEDLSYMANLPIKFNKYTTNKTKVVTAVTNYY